MRCIIQALISSDISWQHSRMNWSLTTDRLTLTVFQSKQSLFFFVSFFHLLSSTFVPSSCLAVFLSYTYIDSCAFLKPPPESHVLIYIEIAFLWWIINWLLNLSLILTFLLTVKNSLYILPSIHTKKHQTDLFSWKYDNDCIGVWQIVGLGLDNAKITQ